VLENFTSHDHNEDEVLEPVLSV